MESVCSDSGTAAKAGMNPEGVTVPRDTPNDKASDNSPNGADQSNVATGTVSQTQEVLNKGSGAGTQKEGESLTVQVEDNQTTKKDSTGPDTTKDTTCSSEISTVSSKDGQIAHKDSTGQDTKDTACSSKISTVQDTVDTSSKIYTVLDKDSQIAQGDSAGPATSDTGSKLSNKQDKDGLISHSASASTASNVKDTTCSSKVSNIHDKDSKINDGCSDGNKKTVVSANGGSILTTTDDSTTSPVTTDTSKEISSSESGSADTTKETGSSDRKSSDTETVVKATESDTSKSQQTDGDGNKETVSIATEETTAKPTSGAVDDNAVTQTGNTSPISAGKENTEGVSKNEPVDLVKDALGNNGVKSKSSASDTPTKVSGSTGDSRNICDSKIGDDNQKNKKDDNIDKKDDDDDDDSDDDEGDGGLYTLDDLLDGELEADDSTLKSPGISSGDRNSTHNALEPGSTTMKTTDTPSNCVGGNKPVDSRHKESGDVNKMVHDIDKSRPQKNGKVSRSADDAANDLMKLIGGATTKSDGTASVPVHNNDRSQGDQVTAACTSNNETISEGIKQSEDTTGVRDRSTEKTHPARDMGEVMGVELGSEESETVGDSRTACSMSSSDSIASTVDSPAGRSFSIVSGLSTASYQTAPESDAASISSLQNGGSINIGAEGETSGDTEDRSKFNDGRIYDDVATEEDGDMLPGNNTQQVTTGRSKKGKLLCHASMNH